VFEFFMGIWGGMMGWILVRSLRIYTTTTAEHPMGIQCHMKMCGGNPVSKHDDNGKIWHAWQCSTCGRVKHAFKMEDA